MHHNLDKYKAANDYPLVMVHGLGAGGALFALSFQELAKHFTVYCIDLPGSFKFKTCVTDSFFNLLYDSIKSIYSFVLF